MVNKENPDPEAGTPIPHPTVKERQEHGRRLRDAVPRSSHAAWSPPANRPDPVALLELQTQSRVAELMPIRYGRMQVSPFAFLRGSAIVMAHDLANTPVSGIRAQLSGDAHLSNFGAYGSPERTLLFDINDFDETLPGPFEWDIKRLAASLVVAGRVNSFNKEKCREAAITAVRSYRLKMLEFASMNNLDVWYSKTSPDEFIDQMNRDKGAKQVVQSLEKGHDWTHIKELDKLSELVGGRRRFIEDPPIIIHLDSTEEEELIHKHYRDYRQTLQNDRRHLLEQFRYVDVARKVVGIGSVGTRCFVVLLEGKDGEDPLFLQVKEAQESVLESVLPKSHYRNHGERIVCGQRLMQAASDIFLGWLTTDEKHDFYWRQLKDMKASVDIETLTPSNLVFYASICGWALARAHARSGDRIQIAAYLGEEDNFERAVASFAEAYANQTELDHQVLVKAIQSGRIKAENGI